MTDLEQILIISLFPTLLYVLLSIFSTSNELDNTWREYMVDQNKGRKLLKPRKRGKK